ncbi:N-acetylaspartate synthetase isoform X2 [Sceloporus undulatus]|uniref:N-acetylaspartate synthetase isoform X2 n=1 Tax=Sceloporus undulatus TaxID=8520 RepID=UPI001C4D00DF|nr:N-acetylaspartate synthetase isoform X2 [Sceloporus undulatus]
MRRSSFSPLHLRCVAAEGPCGWLLGCGLPPSLPPSLPGCLLRAVCMHCLPPEMVCETKIVAEEHESVPGGKKESAVLAAPSSSSSSAPSPPPMWGPSASPAPFPAPGDEEEEGSREGVSIRPFHPSEQEVVRRIFNEGILERIPNTAFRGLKDQPFAQVLYGAMAVMCFVVTKSLLLTCCLPIFLMGMRYYFSRKVILNYLKCALNTDMSDIEQYYMKSPESAELKEEMPSCWTKLTCRSYPVGSCFWVAVLNGNVVGIVAARGNEDDNTVELRRMSVDSKYRGKGIAKALGRKVLEFAMVNNYSSVVLGTTAVKVAAHKLYESLGFKHVGVVEHYSLPGMTHSFLEQMFFQLRYHRYCLQLREE